jgi:putative intracellular protease/amidase
MKPSLLAALGTALLALSGAAAAHDRPLVAVLADPAGSETTDMIAPYAILAESHAVDVEIVSSTLAPVPLMPGVAWVKPHASRASFDRAHPEGPDVVIVPFSMDTKDPDRAAWLRAQAKRGARIVSICQGAEILARAGLLDGRQATTHWANIDDFRKKFPKVTWRRDARWVTDGQFTTGAGVSASVPTTLNLLQELAGEPVMRATAARLGLDAPSVAHNGAGFRLDAGTVGLALANKVSVWGYQRVSVPITDGFDDLGFAAALDGWSRTFRSKAWATAPAKGATSRHGLTVLAAPGKRHYDRTIRPAPGEPEPVVLAEIRAAYGADTARFVALQVEHPAALKRP